MNGPGTRRTWSIILAASLGLNLALGGILVYQNVRAEKSFERRLEQWRRSRDGRPREWQSRSRSEGDTTSRFPHLEREQIERIRALRHGMEEDIQPWRREINHLQELIRTELQKAEPSTARLDSLADRTAELQGLIQKRLLRLMLVEREIFTPEQLRFFLRFMVPGERDYGSGYRREGGPGGSPRDSRGDERGRNPDRSGRDVPPDSQRDPPPPPSVIQALS